MRKATSSHELKIFGMSLESGVVMVLSRQANVTFKKDKALTCNYRL